MNYLITEPTVLKSQKEPIANVARLEMPKKYANQRNDKRLLHGSSY